MIRIQRPNLAAWIVLVLGVGLILVGLRFVSLGLWPVALLLLGVGALFAAVGGSLLISARRYAQRARRLAAVGIATTGKVIDNDARELRTNGNFQRRLRYEYIDKAGVTHTGLSDWMSRSDALRSKPDTTGVVRYDPSRPEVSAWFGRE